MSSPKVAAEWVNIDKLTQWDQNPRINDAAVKDVVKSIKRFGFGSPILARRENGEVIAGHTRLKAAGILGLKEVPVRYLDLDQSEAHLLALADNRLGEKADWDDVLLANVMSNFSLEDVDLAGWDNDAIEELGFSLLDSEPAKDAPKEGEVPDPPKNPVTKLGDVWTLGQHRLVCGDCRIADTVALLIDGKKINVAFTSPPYASQRNYDESSGFKPIPPDKYVDWFDAVQSNVAKHLAGDGSWFVNIKPHVDGLDVHLYVHDLVIAHVRKWGWHFATEFCWQRSGVPRQVTQRFKNQFEPVFQFARGKWKMRPQSVMSASENVPIPGGAGVGSTTWGNERQGVAGIAGVLNDTAPGMAYPGNRLPTFGQADAIGHSGAFPVGLPSFFISAYSDSGDAIFDPFLGSGTTLIAAEQLNRKCYGVELSPAYCDVIVERWQNLTGGKSSR